MAHIVLFHSILGLRPIERQIASVFEAGGHTVTLPDLFGGRWVNDYDSAFPMKKEVGTEAIMCRARAAVDAAPANAVLSGVSFGADLIDEFWQDRPEMPAALLFSGITSWMTPRRPGFKVSAHIARPDPFDDEEYFAAWAAKSEGVDLQLYRYEGVGHYFLDPSLSDFGAEAADLCLKRCLAFLRDL